MEKELNSQPNHLAAYLNTLSEISREVGITVIYEFQERETPERDLRQSC